METEILVAIVTAVVVGAGALLLLRSQIKFTSAHINKVAEQVTSNDAFKALLLSEFAKDGRFKGEDGRDGEDGKDGENGKDGLPGFTEIVQEGDNFAALFGEDMQICWGLADLQANNSHVRSFNFEFAREFSEIPAVTNGVNADASGWSFSVYNYDLTRDSYEGRIVESKGRVNSAPVRMNYIAIGKREV